jgi:CubicO group peptidase (beta-lactamase class C family)
VSGQPFFDYLRGRIFEPLGMVRTDIERTPRVQSELVTDRYPPFRLSA